MGQGSGQVGGVGEWTGGWGRGVDRWVGREVLRWMGQGNGDVGGVEV